MRAQWSEGRPGLEAPVIKGPHPVTISGVVRALPFSQPRNGGRRDGEALGSWVAVPAAHRPNRRPRRERRQAGGDRMTKVAREGGGAHREGKDQPAELGTYRKGKR